MYCSYVNSTYSNYQKIPLSKKLTTHNQRKHAYDNKRLAV